MTDDNFPRIIATRDLKRSGIDAVLAIGEPSPSELDYVCPIRFSLASGEVLWTIEAIGIDAVDAIRGALVIAEARLSAEGDGVVTFLDDTDLHLSPRRRDRSGGRDG